MSGIGLAAVPIAAAVAAAQPVPGTQRIVIDQITAAKLLIESGHFGPARQLLESRVGAQPRNVEALFLLGMIATAESKYDEAISRFRRALVYAPSSTRIRLELARSFYLEKDYENAFRQFQFARAGNPPPAVVAVIERYLAAIRLQKNWSYNFGIALAPDTNINNATSAREAQLFGLPFRLDDSARQKSGVGIAVDGGVEVAPAIGQSSRLRLGAAFQRKDYRGRGLDDTVVAFHAGPRVVTGKWDLSLLGTFFRRWYGGHQLDEGVGIRGEVTWYPDPRAAIDLGTSVQRINYRQLQAQSGLIYAVWGGVVRALSAASSISARAGLSRQKARVAEFSNWAATVGFGYYRDLPGGFSAELEPSIGFARYDKADPFFGSRRKDSIAELRISLLNRRLVFSNFTPRLTYTFARRRSNLEIYSFTQNRLEVGLTTAF